MLLYTAETLFLQQSHGSSLGTVTLLALYFVQETAGSIIESFVNLLRNPMIFLTELSEILTSRASVRFRCIR